MQNLLIEENEEYNFKLNIASNNDGEIYCDIEKNSLIEYLKNIEKNIDDFIINEYNFIIKKPSFGDMTKLYEDIININPVELKVNKMISLIKKWDLRGKEMKEPSEEDIKQLHPVIANAINIQIDSLTGADRMIG